MCVSVYQREKQRQRQTEKNSSGGNPRITYSLSDGNIDGVIQIWIKIGDFIGSECVVFLP